MRFVGSLNGDRRHKGAPFPSPRTFGTLPPQEECAAGMTQSLQELRREVEDDRVTVDEIAPSCVAA